MNALANGDQRFLALTASRAPGDVIEPLGSFSPVRGRRGGSTSTSLHTSSNIEASEGVMSKDDITTFLTRRTMVDGIVLTTDTVSCHELQCKVISEADSIVEHLLVQDKPVLSNWEGCEPR